MKNLIKQLSDISGVTNKIRSEERYQIGTQLIRASHWYNAEGREEISNTLFLYGLSCRKFTSFNDDKLRETISDIGKKNIQYYGNEKECEHIIRLLNLNPEL